jgi:dTDP-4-amino-4,6-dideoxygalactose transaminase
VISVGRYDYPAQFEDIEALTARIGQMLLAGNYVLGQDLLAFERRFAAYLGTGHAIGVNTGTDALLLAMMALGIGPGDQVITQANTFYATVAAICLAGATPVLVDATDDCWLMDDGAVGGAITTRTRAIMPVHLYGKPTPMDAIMTMARTNGLRVIEDAAQAHGARIFGQRAGSIGDIGCFSFHPSKNLAAAGDAGAIVTNDAEIAILCRVRRELGQDGQNQHIALGLNSKIDAIQAVILDAKLDHLDGWNADRRRVAAAYIERLGDLPLRFQARSDDEDHVYHLFQIRCDARDALLSHLRERGIDAVIRYPQPIHLQTAFADRGWTKGQFPVAEALANELLCLPLRPGMTEAEIACVCAAVSGFFGR